MAQQQVFMREVDEALRQDEMADIVKRYGIPIFAVVVAALLGFAGYLWWDHSRTEAIGKNGEQFVMALDKVEAGNLDSADKEFAPLAAKGSGGSATAAKLMRADIALQQKKRDEAIKLYGEVASDDKAPQPFRDLALVRQVAAGFDKMQPADVVARLKPLAVPGNAWFGVAGELVGIAYLEQNKPDLAGPLFAQIAKDKDTPESLKRRARQMAGLLGVDAIDDVARPGAQDTAGGAAAAE